MKRLAAELDISPKQIITFLNLSTHGSMARANYDILKTWLNNQNSREEAYVMMGEALIRAGLNLIAREVLDYPPVYRVYLRALTDDMIEKLSNILTKNDMNRLAPKLDISPEDMYISYMNECNNSVMKDANYDILSRWLKKQNSREEAYVKLGEALIHPDVELNLLAKEVMDYASISNADEQEHRPGVKRKKVNKHQSRRNKKRKTAKSMDLVYSDNGQNHKVQNVPDDGCDHKFRIVPNDNSPGQINGLKSRRKLRKRNRQKNKLKKLN